MGVVWRSQADEIEALRAEVRSLRGEMAVQQVPQTTIAEQEKAHEFESSP